LPSSRCWVLALFWAVLGGVGVLAVFPYLLAVLPQRPSEDALLLALAQAGQASVLFFLLNWLGFRLGQPLGLDAPLSRALLCERRWPERAPARMALALVAGGGTGLVVLVLDQVFQPFLPPLPQPLTEEGIPQLYRLLASLYGAIAEELQFRLFLMTVLVWLLSRLRRSPSAPPARWMFWSALCASALLFGVGHVPLALRLWPPTAVVIGRILLLNGLAGMVFGWLYWRRGLEYAMLAHGAADLVVHGIGG
jgi:membrane protease YdiL (CAAX protease family)